MKSRAEKYDELQRKRRQAAMPAGPQAVARQHDRGKRTARERVEALVDETSFVEFDRFVVHRTNAFGLDEKEFLGDGVITGRATIDGRQVFLFSQDFSVLGGSLGEAFAEKICKVMDLAMRTGSPLIGINDSGGARIQEGVVSLGGYAEIFWRNVQASGVIPQISLIAGPCAGGAVYSPAITDFILMTERISQMFITGPEIIKTVTGEDVTFEELGGATTHATRSGVAHLVATDEANLFDLTRALFSFLPQNNRERPPQYHSDDDPHRLVDALDELVPDSPNKPYDMSEAIDAIVDYGDFLEIQPLYAKNIICGFGRVNGHAVGIVANQPNVLAGVLDTRSSIKAARFVRFCDAFNIPLVTFVDVPGLSAGNRSRVRRNHLARRQAALCLRRGDGSKNHDHHAQGIRRRLRRYGEQTHPRRPKPRMANCRDCRHGRRERGKDDLSARDRVGRRQRSEDARTDRRVHRAIRKPVRCGAARLRRRRDRGAANAQCDLQGARHASRETRPSAGA